MTYPSKYFSAAEMQCKCGCGVCDVSDALMEKLDRLRDAIGHALRVRSGCRCENHNREEGGKNNSAHLSGAGRVCKAVDLQVGTVREAYYLVDEALALDFVGIGPNTQKGFVHLDVADSLPRPALWTY